MMIINRIGELAKQRDMSIQELANAASVTYNTAHNLYTGRATRISFEVLDKMCQALKVKPGDILVQTDEK